MKKINRLFPLISAAFIAVAFFVVLTPGKVHAAPQTFVVNSTSDEGDSLGNGVCETSTPGECTLRAAIAEANYNSNPNDTDVINFNISGSGVHTIQPLSGIGIYEAVKIDGYSQPGSSEGTQAWPNPIDAVPKIELDCGSMPGFGCLVYAEDTSYATPNTLRGLIINNSPTVGIYIQDANTVNIVGNFIGTDSIGQTSEQSQGVAIWLSDFDRSHNVVIGGSAPEDRNIITARGSAVTGNSEKLTVKGNYFGVGADGVTTLPQTSGLSGDHTVLIGRYGASGATANESVTIGGLNVGDGNTFENNPDAYAMKVDGRRNTSINGNRIVGNNAGIWMRGDSTNSEIGNPNSVHPNVISGNDTGNDGTGIYLDVVSGGVKLQSNHIGIAEDGVTAFGNFGHGIYTDGGSQGILIGGDQVGEGNIIANNGYSGIQVTNDNDKISILGNSIYSNSLAGINLGADGGGVTPNDPLDPDSGANDFLNFPSVYAPVVNGSNTDITYKLDVPAGDYRVEFFSNTTADPSGNGEGQTFIGFQNVTSLGSGEQEFTTSVTGNTHTNVFATVTQIDGNSSSGFGVTSEFGDRGVAPDPDPLETDVSVTKELTNPEDIAQGANLNYQITYTNQGPDSLDLTEFSSLFGTPLFLDFLPPELTPSDLGAPGPAPNSFEVNHTGDPDVQCLWAGVGSAGIYLANATNHADYSFIVCAYIGLNTELTAGSSLNLDFNFDVAGDSQLAFNNFVLAFPPSISVDPDAAELETAQTSTDLIDYLLALNTPPNNFAVAQLPANLDISTSLVNQGTIKPDDDVYYDLTLTNNGSTGVDLSHYTTLPRNLFIGVFSGTDLSYIDNSSADITCSDLGPGSVAYIGPSGSDHPDYQLLACIHDQSSDVILPGQNFNVRLHFKAKPAVAETFSFYAYAGTVYGDPDLPALIGYMSAATGDVLDLVDSNNYARVAYSISSDGSSSTDDMTDTDLSGTGQDSKPFVLLAAALLFVGGGASYVFVRRRRAHKL